MSAPQDVARDAVFADSAVRFRVRRWARVAARVTAIGACIQLGWFLREAKEESRAPSTLLLEDAVYELLGMEQDANLTREMRVGGLGMSDTVLRWYRGREAKSVKLRGWRIGVAKAGEQPSAHGTIVVARDGESGGSSGGRAADLEVVLFVTPDSFAAKIGSWLWGN